MNSTFFSPKGMSGVLGKNPSISGRRLQKGQGLSICQGTSGTTLRHSLFFGHLPTDLGI